jgi:transposase
LIKNKLLTVSLFNCSITTEVFEGWIEHDLLPKLKEKSIRIMDNATFHKGKSLKKLIQEADHYLVWLPKYSPDLNLIEKM